MNMLCLPSRLARAGLCLALALAAAGCVTTQSASTNASLLDRPPSRGGHLEPYLSGAARYVLKQDMVIAGTPVPKGSDIYGLPVEGQWHTAPADPKMQWVLPPVYEHLSGYGKVMYGKRFGQPQWVRIDLSGPSPKETPSPYVMVRRIPGDFDRSRIGPGDQWVAIEAGSGQPVFLDAQGRPAFRTDALKTPKEPRNSVTVLHGGEAFVVSHPEHDRIYAKDGTPRSPAIPPLWKGRLAEAGTGNLQSWPAVAVQLDAGGDRPLYWPINRDGSIMPKPDDLIGLQPIKVKRSSWDDLVGWLVWWQTPEGERCVRVESRYGMVEPRAIIESRSNAHYVEWELEVTGGGELNDIRRRAGQDRYEVLTSYKYLEPQTYASVQVARDSLQASIRAANLAYAERQQRTRDQQKAQEAAQAAQRQQALARSGQDTRSYEERATTGGFDLAMNNGDRLLARKLLLKILYDPQRWTRYVKTYGFDPAGNNSSDSVSYARAWGSGTDFTELQAAARRAPIPLSKPNAAPPPKQMSDWEYFWHGKPTGVGRIGEGASPSATTDALRSRLRATEQQNFDAWMRGAQNWGAKRL